MIEEIRVVLISVPDKNCADGMARTLVEERLVACVNVIPQLTSYYRWNDQIQCSTELLLVAKTTQARSESLIKRVVELHPYGVPQVVLLPLCDGFEPYCRWVHDELS